MPRQFVFKLCFTLLALGFVVVLLLFVAELFYFKSEGGSSNTTGDRVSDSLKFVVVVSRHGNRGAHYDYPYDPYPLNNTLYWPYGVNGLTTYGRLQMYQLGGKVRSLYNGFLNASYVPDELHGSSTDLDRTLMSGEGFLAGLYPPKGWQLWDSSIPWQPTPLYSDSHDKLPVIMSCPRFVQEMESVKASFLQEFSKNITVLSTIFNYATGGNYSGAAAVTQLYYLWDKAISEVRSVVVGCPPLSPPLPTGPDNEIHTRSGQYCGGEEGGYPPDLTTYTQEQTAVETEGYGLAGWVSQLYPDRLRGLIAQEYIALFGGTDEMTRLIIGSFFGEMLEVMQSKANGSLSSRKLQLYSGHDSSIIALQVVLGVPRSDIISIVKPGSALVFEMHQNSTDDPFTVQVLYLDGGSDYDVSVVTTSCGDPCDLDNLANMTLRYYTDIVYEAECNATTTPSASSLRTSPLAPLFL